MTLDEFDTAHGVEGRLYELSRSRVIVTDVPSPRHGDTISRVHQQLATYRRHEHGVVLRAYGAAECKLLIEPTESERHPDVAIYMTEPPCDDSSVWSIWVPEIVVEVVSPGSEHRDYEEKPEDYLHFGVKEYWVIDGSRGVITVHRRMSGRWQKRELTKADRYSTHLLPGFELVADALLPE